MQTTLWNDIAKEEGLRVIAPGLVYLPNALSEAQQIWLARYALFAGNDPAHGFWHSLPPSTDEGDGEQKPKRVLNSDVGRGRIYDAIETFPESKVVQELCEKVVDLVREVDPKMPAMDPTHLLLLYYATTDGMYWHSDSDKNDGDNDHPIVSITIGNTCEFGYKLYLKGETFIQLRSGDILVWGGPNRMLPHCVQSVLPYTSPKYLHHLRPLGDDGDSEASKESGEGDGKSAEGELANVRLNFTFRDAPNVRGREKDFKYDVDSTYTALLPHLLATVAPNPTTKPS